MQTTHYLVIVFCSWGDYDLKQLKQDCDFHEVPYPISASHLNVKRLMAERQGLAKKPGLGEAVRLAKMEFVGSHHRASTTRETSRACCLMCLARRSFHVERRYA